MSLPLTMAVLKQLAVARVAEAGHLLNAGYFSGAYYLGGYAVELALKACIAEAFQPRSIPDKRFVLDIYTHDLRNLVILAGLEADRLARSKADARFAEHWETVRAWSESTRYDISDETTARSLVDALRDPDYGVFEWIRSRW